jgi:hypothetical protein
MSDTKRPTGRSGHYRLGDSEPRRVPPYFGVGLAAGLFPWHDKFQEVLMPKTPLADTSTEDLLREAAGRRDLPDAVTRLGGKALLFDSAKPEWHVAIPAAGQIGRAATLSIGRVRRSSVSAPTSSSPR